MSDLKFKLDLSLAIEREGTINGEKKPWLASLEARAEAPRTVAQMIVDGLGHDDISIILAKRGQNVDRDWIKSLLIRRRAA